MKAFKKAIAGLLSWILKDEALSVGSIRVCHPGTTYTDDIEEKTVGAGVIVKKMRSDSGASFPAAPVVGQFFYRTDLKAPFVFVGIGEPGTTDGWFNLKQALYA